MIISGIVNNQSDISFSDGDDARILLGKTAEQLVANQHDGIYSLTYRGKIFHGYSITSATIPITSTTSPTFILWNPRSSNINIIPVEYVIGYESGTNKEGNIQFAFLKDVASQVTTGGAISAFTDGNIINGITGDGNRYKAKFGVAATLTSAATIFYPLGISLMQLAANNSAPVFVQYKFNGQIILSPGTAMFSCASAATVAKYHERITWYEYPI